MMQEQEKYSSEKAFVKWLVSKGFKKIDSSKIQEQYILFSKSDVYGAMQMDHTLYDLGLYCYAEDGSEENGFDEVYDLLKFVELRGWNV
jgi:hypothetical protein